PHWMHRNADVKAGFAQILKWIHRFIERIFNRSETLEWSLQQHLWLHETNPAQIKRILKLSEYVLRQGPVYASDVPSEISSSSDESGAESDTEQESTLQGQKTPQTRAAELMLEFRDNPSEANSQDKHHVALQNEGNQQPRRQSRYVPPPAVSPRRLQDALRLLAEKEKQDKRDEEDI
ncbi:MAG: hypothetical protein GY739_18130, partial [Mesoflavibacter sp.]|nr:hypothetical protein [Mesoflavibacter sp.]